MCREERRKRAAAAAAAAAPPSGAFPGPPGADPMAALRAANPALAGMDPATGEGACYFGRLKAVTFV
jgi:hypothetical protein